MPKGRWSCTSNRSSRILSKSLGHQRTKKRVQRAEVQVAERLRKGTMFRVQVPVARFMETPPITLFDAIIEALIHGDQMSPQSLASELTALVAYGDMQIVSWKKEPLTAELVQSRVPAVIAALRALEKEKRVGRVPGSIERWQWLPPEPDRLLF